LKSLTGKIIAEKSKYGEEAAASPIAPPLNPHLYKTKKERNEHGI